MKKIFIAAILSMITFVGFAQQMNRGMYMGERMAEIEKSGDKLSYLKEFLHDVSSNAAKYYDASEEVRDSISNKMQADYNAILLTIFKPGGITAANKSIAANTGKAYGKALQVINGNELLPAHQKKIARYIAAVEKALDKL